MDGILEFDLMAITALSICGLVMVKEGSATEKVIFATGNSRVVPALNVPENSEES